MIGGVQAVMVPPAFPLSWYFRLTEILLYGKNQRGMRSLLVKASHRSSTPVS